MLGFEDAQSQATLAGLWNAAYAVGWAAGPFAGGIVYELYQQVVLCMGRRALPPRCPAAEPALAASKRHPRDDHPQAPHCADATAAAGHCRPLNADTATVEGPAVLEERGSGSLPSSAPDCSCVWQPGNGFDGFASAATVVSLAFGVFLFVVAFRMHPPR